MFFIFGFFAWLLGAVLSLSLIVGGVVFMSTFLVTPLFSDPVGLYTTAFTIAAYSAVGWIASIALTAVSFPRH